MNTQIGRRLRRRRTEWGYTQSDLADATGIDRTKINKIEAGERDVKADEAVSLARALDITVEELVRVGSPVQYRLDGATADTRRADAWFDDRIEYSQLVRDLLQSRAR